MFGFAKGVLLCMGITFFAVTLWPAQGEAIVGSQSGHYIVALLDKAHSVFPPEIHQVVDPYLNKIEQRLNPNFQPHGQDMHQMWPGQVRRPRRPAGRNRCRSKRSHRNNSRHGRRRRRNRSRRGHVVATVAGLADAGRAGRQTNGSDPYPQSPREPNPFPGPYSAEVPASRDY